MPAVKSPLPVVVAAVASLAALSAAVVAETAAGIPKDAYYREVLTAGERSGIAQEENVTPNDGRPSVPNRQDFGVIPDATVDQNSIAKEDPQPLPETAEKKKPAESEANVVIDDSKKNYKVTKKDMADCMKNWSPQTQMTRSEWASSCRTTLEYFPDRQ